MPEKSAEKFARVVKHDKNFFVLVRDEYIEEYISEDEAILLRDQLNAAHEKAVQEALLDVMTVELFEKAPCYVCGYNSEGYYQPDIHPCAKKYHAIRALRGNG